MSIKTVRHSIPKFSGQSLAVTQCGITGYSGGHSYGPYYYPQYSAHFVISGKGTYIADGKSYSLKAGEGFMIMPDVLITYTADEEDPWEYIYASFDGADAETLVRSAGLSRDNMIFSFEMTDEILSDLNRMRECSKDISSKSYDITGCFLLVMSKLVKSETEKNGGFLLPEQYIRKALSYIDDHYHNGIKINEIAANMGLDRTYLYKLFKKNLGISPIEYLNNYRLERAVSLMSHDDITMEEIASSVGFCDTSHFCKAFSKKFGVTPGEYRKKNIKKSI